MKDPNEMTDREVLTELGEIKLLVAQVSEILGPLEDEVLDSGDVALQRKVRRLNEMLNEAQDEIAELEEDFDV